MSSSNAATASSHPAEQLEQASDPSLLELSPAQLAAHLWRLDWSFEDAQKGSSVHGLHPYPAKFVADLPRRFIQLLSRPGELIADPFSGGGTCAVEALSLSRRFFGIDANPVGNVIARAKTQPITEDDSAALRDLEAALLALDPAELKRRTPSWLPAIPNCAKWYDRQVFRALGVIRDLAVKPEQQGARDVALVAFVQAAAKLSFQESETRYVSAPRQMDVIEVPRAMLVELRRIRRLVEDLPESQPSPARFVDGDARDPDAFQVDDDAVGLLVTSPPYPNTYDYHLYHRFRLFWLGADPKELRKVEIGSHLKNQSLDDPIGAYLADMRTVLENSLRALAPGRHAVFVVGDGLFCGKVFRTASALAAAAQEIGYDHVTTIDRPLPDHRRSMTKAGRRLAAEQILVLRRPPEGRVAVAIQPNYALFSYEEDLSLRELEALGASPRLTADGEFEVSPVAQLDQAAFTHGLRLPDGTLRPTRQCRIEGVREKTTRRKNSTYFGHGIHRYKGKFYPQLVKGLLNLSGLVPGESLVADPFGGSGTVALEATLAGIDAVSFDCNPVAVAVARAKVALAGAEGPAISARLASVRAKLEATSPGRSRSLTQFTDENLDELHSWFSPAVLRKLDCLLGVIRGNADGETRNVLEVLASDLIREVSHQDPKDLRIRRRKEPLTDAPVFELFLTRLEELQARLATFSSEFDTVELKPGAATIIQGDSGDSSSFASLEGRSVDAVLSSPPYAAALPYIDTDRLSLCAVFGYSRSQRRDLEQAMIGSREISKREQVAYGEELASGAASGLPESTLTFLSRFGEAVQADRDAGFRRRQGPAVLFRYFCAMHDVLSNVYRHLHRGASCRLVLGDSRSTIGGRRWVVPTVDEVSAIAQQIGLTLVDSLPITVTREGMVHARHSITRNEILHLRR